MERVALPTNGKCHPADPGLPEKALKLARRAAGLGSQSAVYELKLIVTEDGEWLLAVDGGKVERLGRG